TVNGSEPPLPFSSGTFESSTAASSPWIAGMFQLITTSSPTVASYEDITGSVYDTPSTSTVARGLPVAVIFPTGLSGFTGPVTAGEPFTQSTRTGIPGKGG